LCIEQPPIGTIGTLKKNSSTFGCKKTYHRNKTFGGHDFVETDRSDLWKNGVIKSSEKGALESVDRIVMVTRGAKGKLMTISTGQRNQAKEERVLPETNELEY
jgi:hypothetical protein